MKLPWVWRLAWVSAAAMVPAMSGIDRLPVGDFARPPETARARLSPDGERLAFLRERGGNEGLHVLDLNTGHLVFLDVGEAAVANDARKEVGDFSWVGDRRLAVTTTVWDRFYGVFAVDSDGRRAVPLSGYEGQGTNRLKSPDFFGREIIHRFYDADQSVLMLDRHWNSTGAAHRPDVVLVRTATGSVKTVVKNPGEVVAWGVDSAGVVRAGVLSHGDLKGAIYRRTEREPWRTVLPLENRRGLLRPLGFDSANERLMVAALTPEKRWTVFPLDTETGALGEALLADPVYDILPDHFVPSIDGVPLAAPIFSRRKEELLGIRYVTDAARVKWFSPEFARHQVAIDRANPDTVNLLVDLSQDGKRMLWLAYSDQNPGFYVLADLEKRSLRRLASRMPWIKPEQMAPMLAIKYPARDGLEIHGCLTVPNGFPPKGLPMVVLPHGGPWVRDVWGFDPLVQLLANRGYAVLQMNYRGSPGFGEELYLKARLEIGRKIQDDIEDATRWAIASGLADPKRIAIMGTSYGGYSTLFALAHSAELYRCGISLMGVTDWMAFFQDSDVADYRSARTYWHEQLGDPAKDAERLKTISPVNFAGKITAPAFIIQGKEDKRVPPDQAKRMIAALERAGKKPQSLFVSGLGHSHGNQKQRTEIYSAILTFLEDHLGPGVQ